MTLMQAFQAAAAVAAVVIAVGPQVSAVLRAVVVSRPAVPVAPKPPPPAAGPSYQQAMLDLSSVRLRLVKTDGLNEDTKKSIDTLTLALVAGSDK